MTTQDNTDGDDAARECAVAMLKSGEAREAEIAEVAGVGRSLVHYWAKIAGVDSTKARKTWIAQRWRAKMGKAAPKQGLSKAEMRKMASSAVAKLNRKTRARRKGEK